MNRCFTVCVIREMLIKTVMRYHCTLTRKAKQPQQQMLEMKWEKNELLVIAGGNSKLNSYYEDYLVVSFLQGVGFRQC
jgi:hypothetical protein